MSLFLIKMISLFPVGPPSPNYECQLVYIVQFSVIDEYIDE